MGQAPIDRADAVQRIRPGSDSPARGQALNAAGKIRKPKQPHVRNRSKGLPSVLPAGVQSNTSARRIRLSQAPGLERESAGF